MENRHGRRECDPESSSGISQKNQSYTSGNWQQVNNLPTNDYENALANVNGTVYAGTYQNGLWTVTDSTAFIVVGAPTEISALADMDGTLYMGGDSGVSSINLGYTVIYDGNNSTGGSVPTDSNTYQNGASVTGMDNTGNLVKTGYTFSG